MAPATHSRFEYGSRPVLVSATDNLAWMNQASWRHCHFGLKSAPLHRDFRPEQEGVL